MSAFCAVMQLLAYYWGMSKRLVEVARKVGVSEATVSRVLNDKPGVSDATRQAVLTALDVLGYERPTKLRGEGARLAGLILPDIQNPLYTAFADVISATLAQNGYATVLCVQSAGGITESAYINLLLQQRVSGVIIVEGLHSHLGDDLGHYDRLLDVHLPTVLVNGRAHGLDFVTVSADDRSGVEQAMRHLRQLGHSTIGLLLGPEDRVTTRRRLACARELSAELGIAYTDELVAYFDEFGRVGAGGRVAPVRSGCDRIDLRQ